MYICTHDISFAELPFLHVSICDVTNFQIITCGSLVFVRQVVCLPPFYMTFHDIAISSFLEFFSGFALGQRN